MCRTTTSFWTILHEISHAIGLSHSGDHNAGSGKKPITYEANAEYIQDSRQYTVMSYFDESKTGADFRDNLPLAPLLHDIAAVQAIYGASTLTRGLNTVSGWWASQRVSRTPRTSWAFEKL